MKNNNLENDFWRKNVVSCAQIVDSSRSTGRVLLRTENLSDLIKRGYRGYRKNIDTKEVIIDH